jgi:hypothetical protein
VDLDKDTLKRYPEFQRDAFMSMNDEEARRYEWRVLEAIDPEAARSSTSGWDYEQYPYYRQPEWFEPSVVSSSYRARQTGTGARREREVAIVEEREGRERVVAREERAPDDAPRSEGERMRGRGSDER